MEMKGDKMVGRSILGDIESSFERWIDNGEMVVVSLSNNHNQHMYLSYTGLVCLCHVEYCFLEGQCKTV